MNEDHYLVPQHEQGSKTDLQYSTAADSTEDAEYWFVDAKDRLLDVNSWNKYCPAIMLSFRLTDGHGLGVGRHARKGDLIRIDMPGPDGARLGGFEWLSIEAIEYDDYPDTDMETFAMRIKVAGSPLNHNNGQMGHISDNASITFVIERHGAKLSATYHGRNDAGGNDTLSGIEWEGLIKAFID